MTTDRDALTWTNVLQERQPAPRIRSARTRKVATFAVVPRASCYQQIAGAKTWTSASSPVTLFVRQTRAASTRSVHTRVNATRDSGSMQRPKRLATMWMSARSSRVFVTSVASMYSVRIVVRVRLATSWLRIIGRVWTSTSARSTSPTTCVWDAVKIQWDRMRVRVRRDTAYLRTVEHART